MQLGNIHLQRIYWAIFSPPLLSYPLCNNYVKDEPHKTALTQQLRELDNHSAFVGAHFNNLRHMPMGKYFEQLLFFIIDNDPRYELILTNHQIIESGRTVGELDLILRDTVTLQLEHWEICLKYYLCSATSNDFNEIIGPNAKDRLHRKFRKLTERQLPLSKHPQVTDLFSNQLIEPKLFMKGQLFNHLNNENELPSVIHKDMEKGWWCHLNEIKSKITGDCRWTIVSKPDWIGAYTCAEHKTCTAIETLQSIESHFKSSTAALLLVGMQPHENQWVEKTRGFVVSNNWPLRTPSNG